MSAGNMTTAYSVAVPEKQLPRLNKHFKPGVEYTKLEIWDDNGRPSLREYQGSGKLQNKTAIITDGDSGIGRAAAIMFAREGCTGSGAQVNLAPCDLMEEADCRKLVESRMQKFGKLNVLVNNASKQIMCKNFEDIELGNVGSTFRSNILQMFAVTKFALPHLKRGSNIINTTSVTAYKGSLGLVDYSATKGAIVTFTRSLSTQLAPRGIRVNAIASGPVITALQAGSRSAENMEGLGVGMPLHGRAAQPAELGPAYVFLASSDSTRHALHINSGQHVGGS